MTLSPIVEAVTTSCPVRGCSWTLSLPALRGAPTSTYAFGLTALEVLSHILGTYGADGRTPHTADEINTLSVLDLGVPFTLSADQIDQMLGLNAAGARLPVASIVNLVEEAARDLDEPVTHHLRARRAIAGALELLGRPFRPSYPV